MSKLMIVDLRLVENKQVVAYEYLAGTRVDFTMEDLTDQGRQILLGLKDGRSRKQNATLA